MFKLRQRVRWSEGSVQKQMRNRRNSEDVSAKVARWKQVFKEMCGFNSASRKEEHDHKRLSTKCLQKERSSAFRRETPLQVLN